MKAAASALLLGAASTALAEQQQVFQMPRPLAEAADAWSKPLHNLEDALKSLTGEAKQLWDEVAMMFPEAIDSANFFSTPKPHNRKHDSEWDHILKGADVQSVWVENAQGQKERDVEGKLEQFSLRTKKVDPKSLGVDDVKQYSGYLDNDEDDKHLFYCKSRDAISRLLGFSNTKRYRVLRVSQ